MGVDYSKYKLALIQTGTEEGQWGDITNANIGSSSAGVYQGLEQAIGGKATITFSGATETLTLTDTSAAQNARALYLDLDGPPGGAATLNVPAIQKAYIVKNGTTGGFAVTVKVSGQTGVSVPNGSTMWLYNNGTDVVNAVTNLPAGATVDGSPISGGGGSGTVTSVDVSGGTTGLTTSGGPITTSGTVTLAGTLAAANGGTGQNNYSTGDILYASASNALSRRTIGSTGQVLTVSGGVPAWVTPSSGGSVTSVSGTGTVNGITLTGTVTTSGSLTLGGTLSGVSLSSQVTGTLPIGNGGTGSTTQSGARTNLGLGSVATLNSISLTSNVTGTLPTANGGTGSTSLTGAGIVTTGDTQTISGAKTFSSFTAAAQNYSSNTSNYGSVLSGGQYLQINFDINGTRRLDMTGSLMNISQQTIPFGDNSYSFGRNGNRWTAVWAVNGAIQTSDQRLKTNITTSDLGLSFISRLRPVSYKWIVGENVEDGFITEEIYDENNNVVRTSKIPTYSPRAGVRTHYGLISQEVKAALDAENVEDFGGWVLDNKDDPNSQQNLRYDQFISPMIKAIQELKAELDTVKAELAALKNEAP